VLLAEIAAVYQAGFGRFLRVAAVILGDVERGRDAVQDAFARAIIRRREYRGDGPVDAWLWRIVVNHARNCRRHESSARSPDDRPSLDEAAPTADAGDAGLRRLIASLPERQRTALFLRYYADLDYEQIAHALGIRPGTVGATLNAAHRTLRERLKASGLSDGEESL
jgi:RNA polymerase sigma-70 factor, ECF subfamily